MTDYEKLQLVVDLGNVIADNVQFWMGATFALVIASYTAGDRLALWARAIIAIL